MQHDWMTGQDVIYPRWLGSTMSGYKRKRMPVPHDVVRHNCIRLPDCLQWMSGDL